MATRAAWLYDGGKPCGAEAITENVYDTAGNVVTTIRFAARPTLTEYTETAINAAVNRNDADNQVTRYAYDAANRLRYTVDALGSVSEKAMTRGAMSSQPCAGPPARR